MLKTEETGVLRDLIHGYIHVGLKVIWGCINAKEMQRLRRVHQLGEDFQVYRTVEHLRFSYSLGVYEIVRHMAYEINRLREVLSGYEKAIVMLVSLLHDIGHGPSSRAFEEISTYKYKEYTVRTIMENSKIHQILTTCDARLLKNVASTIQYRHTKGCMNQLVNGQLDVDHIDYLLWDAYFTGTNYGKFGLE